MSRMRASRFILLLSLLAPPILLTGQQSPGRVSPGLQPIVRPAGYIFAGKVLAIHYEPVSASGQVPSVRITFRIEDGIRGARAGESVTIREWAGLWNAGERYRVGERVVLFLYPASKLGLTSPVGAALGRFAIDQSGHVITDSQQASMFRGLEPRTPILRGRIRLRDFTRVVRRGLLEED